jgi:glycosyltransferase involved in cell wall biosynthesis
VRIACIATSTVPSRTANSLQVMKVCQALFDLGHELCLWLPQGPSPGWEALSEHYGIRGGFPIRRLHSLGGLKRYDYCLRAVLAARRWRPDLVYAWPIQAAAFASSLGLLTVLEMHDLPQGRLGPRLIGVFLRGRGARRLAYTTQPLRAWVEAHYTLPKRVLFAVKAPNGVDSARYAELPEAQVARRQLGLAEGFTAGYTGHLYEGRGIALLAEMARQNPEVHFLWIGGEPAAVTSWRTRLREAGIENVRLMGFVANTELPRLQAACDVLMMPYEHRIAVSSGGDTAATASPMKVFEYLAAGRTILASDLPVLREVLNPENAMLLPAEDTAAWTHALRTARSDPALRAQLGARARVDAELYSWTGREQRILDGLEAERAD